MVEKWWEILRVLPALPSAERLTPHLSNYIFPVATSIVELELHYKRGWKGETDILGWDKACRVFYIAYWKYTDNNRRSETDHILVNRKYLGTTWERRKIKLYLHWCKCCTLCCLQLRMKARLGGGMRKKESVNGDPFIGKGVTEWRNKKHPDDLVPGSTSKVVR